MHSSRRAAPEKHFVNPVSLGEFAISVAENGEDSERDERRGGGGGGGGRRMKIRMRNEE